MTKNDLWYELQWETSPGLWAAAIENIAGDHRHFACQRDAEDYAIQLNMGIPNFMQVPWRVARITHACEIVKETK